MLKPFRHGNPCYPADKAAKESENEKTDFEISHDPDSCKERIIHKIVPNGALKYLPMLQLSHNHLS